MKRFIVFLVVALISINSCKRWDCPSKSRNYDKEFNEEFISYFAKFNTGSYWIYMDSVSNQIDTLILENFHRNFGASFHGDCEYHEFINYQLIGKNQITLRAETNGEINKGMFSFNFYKYSVEIDYNYPDFFDVNNGNAIVKIDSIEVLGKNYTDVIKCQSSEQNITMYFASAIGLVRLDYIENNHFIKSLKLKNYEINF